MVIHAAICRADVIVVIAIFFDITAARPEIE
jgi:hypothetical protein